MRLLLLLSAFLTALTGAAIGTVASAQPIQASASATHAKPVAAAKAAPLPEEVRGAFAAPGTWRTGTYPAVRSMRTVYGERRRE